MIRYSQSCSEFHKSFGLTEVNFSFVTPCHCSHQPHKNCEQSVVTCFVLNHQIIVHLATSLMYLVVTVVFAGSQPCVYGGNFDNFGDCPYLHHQGLM